MYLWIILGALAAYLFYKKLYKSTQYWKERNVTHIRAVPFFGSMGSNLYYRLPLTDLLMKMYSKFPNAKYVGLHQFTSPILMLQDPDMIKQITVKDFDSFMNHKTFLTEDNDPIFGKNLLSLKGQKWKDMRSTLSPAFTSSKMRTMYILINECAEQFVQYFLNESKKENGMVEVEMKDIFTRYTNDVIATAAFGIQCDSLTHKENEFYMVGKKSTNFGGSAIFKIIGYVISPKLMKFLGIHFIDKKVTDFFSDLIISTLRLREKEGTVRPDMIHLLMEARKGHLKHESTEKSENDSSFSAVEESSIGKAKQENKLSAALTDEDIIAQAFLFFFAGYDTGSTMMGFMAYELAVNPDVQQKLYEEIAKVIEEGKVNYESILKMKYLDMVVSESLRKWPPAALTERLCEKPYVIENTNENEPPLTIEKDVSVWIPVYAIHHDPKYFPNPEKFDPERFNDENKNSITPFTYLPFGVGPRNCIGSRFALLEIKTLFVHFLSKFELTVIEKTQIPLKIDGKKFNLTTEKGIWIGLKPRV